MKFLRKVAINKYFLHPLFILFLFNLEFFGGSLLLIEYLSPSDALQRFPSFNLGEFYVAKNSLLFGVVTQFQPWYKYIFYDHGNILWNDLNAGGVPFLANSISAVLFPLNIVFLLFPIRTALIAFYFLKLYLIGLFTYLFLREIKIGKYESLVGATAFNFAGFNIVWMFWPQTNVIVFLPILLLLTEKLVNGSMRNYRFIVYFAVSVALVAFAGHPETAVHIFLISFAYLIFRVLTVKKSLARKWNVIKLYLLASLTGLLLAGIQIVPFLEYLFNSNALVQRSTVSGIGAIPLDGFIYNIFPNIGGNPSTSFYRPLISDLNYNELAGGYSGQIILFLAVLAVISLFKKNEYAKMFTSMSLFALLFIYKLPVADAVLKIFSKYIMNIRLLFFIAFSQAILGSLFLVHLTESKKYRVFYIFAIISVIAGSVLLLLVINKLTPIYLWEFSPAKVYGFTAYLNSQVRNLALYFIAALVLLLLLIYKPRQKKFWLIALSILVFAQTGITNIGYNPSIEKEYFFPQNSDIEFLKSLPKGRYIELGGDEIVPADTNLYYGLASASNYDALDIRDYKKLYDEKFSNKTSWRTILNAQQDDLDRFGINYVLSYTDINKKIDFIEKDAAGYDSRDRNNNFHTIFKAGDNNLTAVRLLPANFNRLNNCKFRFVLSEAGTKEIYNNVYHCSALSDKIFFQINFPAIKESINRIYNIDIDLIDSNPDNSISFWKSPKGNLTLHAIYDIPQNPHLKLLKKGTFNIYENTSVKSYYYFKSDNKYSEVSALVTAPTYTKLSVKNEDADVLSSTLSYYPGWKAYVDGKKVNIAKDNAFRSVELTAGEHVVEFKYVPESLIAGLFLSFLGIIFLFILYRRNFDNSNSSQAKHKSENSSVK